MQNKELSSGTSDEQRTNVEGSHVSPACAKRHVSSSCGTLHLNLHSKWFDMILSGIKKEEYREVKRFWICRLLANIEYLTDLEGVQNVGARFKHYDFVEFKNGYSKTSPMMIVECKGISVGKSRPEWSEGFADDCFVISLGNVVKSTA